jgi:AAA15 family ATPase/GTPase
MFLEQLRLTNLLSIGNEAETFTLQALNVIIGPNGSGKSNILEAIELLSNAPDQLAKSACQRVSSGGLICWLGGDARRQSNSA